MDKYLKTTQDLSAFIQKSPTCYHAIRSASEIFQTHGFRKLSETAYWKLEPDGKYYVIRSDASVIAFTLPAGKPENYQIVASHSDSPTFKIKENEEILSDGAYVKLNVEKYGGMLCAPWFDRPLSVAGRIVAEIDGKLVTKLINIDRDLVMIPNLAIHMNRDANSGIAYSIQTDMLPIIGDETDKGNFRALIAENAGVDASSILSTDLFLYSRTAPSVWGADNQYFSSARLDDLQCAYSSVAAFVESKNSRSLNVCCIFDNEEVGSRTKQGADSTFLEDVLERIRNALGMSAEESQMCIAGGFMLSADNAHAVHPNHGEKADPTNRPHMNKGIVLKYNSNQKYTTDSVSSAVFKAICRKADVPVQIFFNHSDVAGGSTLGNISNSHVSINTADIGLPQLAMHSPYETAGVKDTWYMIEAMKTFYNSTIVYDGEGTYTID